MKYPNAYSGPIMNVRYLSGSDLALRTFVRELYQTNDLAQRDQDMSKKIGCHLPLIHFPTSPRELTHCTERFQPRTLHRELLVVVCIMTVATSFPLTLTSTAELGRLSSSSSSRMKSVDVYKPLPYKRKSLPPPRAYHQPSHTSHDLKVASTLLQHHQNQQHGNNCNNSNNNSSSGLLTYEGAMSLRWQMLAVHQRRVRTQSQQQQQQQSASAPYHSSTVVAAAATHHSNHHQYHCPETAITSLYDLEWALSTTDSILHHANVAQQQQQQQHHVHQHHVHQQQQQPVHVDQYYYAPSTEMYSTVVSQSPRRSFDSLSSSSLSSSQYCGASYSLSPRPLKKGVTFAATNTITWYDAGTHEDVDQAWYGPAHYQQFEADNRQIVARVLSLEKQKAQTTTQTPSQRSTTLPPHVVELDHEEYSTHGLEQYIAGRKPMLQRKLGILQHAAMVLEMYEEQRRVGIGGGSNTQCPTKCEQQQQQQQQHRMWMDPELIRKVSLRFSREPLQRALQRAAALAESTRTNV
jgi:hypothetical protein